MHFWCIWLVYIHREFILYNVNLMELSSELLPEWVLGESTENELLDWMYPDNLSLALDIHVIIRLSGNKRPISVIHQRFYIQMTYLNSFLFCEFHRFGDRDLSCSYCQKSQIWTSNDNTNDESCQCILI